MKDNMTSAVNQMNRKENRTYHYKKKVRIMLAVTCLSVLTTCVTIVLSVLICTHYKFAGEASVTFAESDAGQEKEQGQGEILEAFSDSAYSQTEVDALMEAARENASAQGAAEILATLQSRLTEGDSSLSIFRDLYPDHVVLVDAGQYCFIPKTDAVREHPYDPVKFVMGDDGVLSYADEQVTTYKGIDVSKYQGEIDWKQVKDGGIEFAIVRAGIRGYSAGAIVPDDTFVTNVQEAAAQGIALGTYFFTQATSEAEAIEEAQFVIQQLQEAEVHLEYPVYLDVEAVSSSNCRTKDLTVEQRTTYAKTFLNQIAEAGYEPALYGNLKSYMLMLDIVQLEEYDKWLAAYSLPLYYPYDFQMLQYTESGRVPGISEPVDMNLCLKRYGGEE